MKMRYFILAFALLFTGCVTTDYMVSSDKSTTYTKPTIGIEEYYTAIYRDDEIPEEGKLQSTEDPKVYYTDKYDLDASIIKSNYYEVLGYSAYVGPFRDPNDLKDLVYKFCKLKRAKIALYSYKYKETIKIYDIDVDRYEYRVVLFFSLPKSFIDQQLLGVIVHDLDQELRIKLQRNTGVYIDVVYMDSPAFFANLMKGDIIIKINDINIYNKKTYQEVVDKLKKGNLVIITFLRNGLENSIKFII